MIACFAAFKGREIEGSIGGALYCLGNHLLVMESGASTPALETQLDALEKQGKTAIVLIEGPSALAISGIADTIRAESKKAIFELKLLSITPVMLRSDNRHKAHAIARQIGVEDVRSDCCLNRS